MVLSVLKLTDVRSSLPQPIRILGFFFVMIYIVTNVLYIEENYEILPLSGSRPYPPPFFRVQNRVQYVFVLRNITTSVSKSHNSLNNL